MKNPEVLLVPVLMIADYYLTVAGSILYDRGYGNHIRFEQYELNPAWQSSIQKKVWLNPRHLIRVFVTFVLVYIVSEFGDRIFWWVPDWFLGALIMVFSAVVGRHLSNVLMFLYVLRNPSLLSGEARMKQVLVLKFSQYQLVALLVPVSIITAFMPNPFLAGCMTGLLLLNLIQTYWIRKTRKG